jgi:hypothetical protein
VSERTVANIIRGLVAIAMASAVIATWAVRMTFTTKSGTLYGLLVYIPVLAAPGWLVWKRPLATRFLAIWAAVGWLSTIAWFTFGLPYESERRLAGWETIKVSLLVAVAVVLLAAPIAAFVVAGYNRRGTTVQPEQELIAQRLRRIVQLALGLGIVALGLSLVPLEAGIHGMIAPAIAIDLAIVLAPGVLVLRAPRRKWAWLWTVWTAPTALLSSLFVTDLYDRVPTTWQLSFAACGTIYVLLLAVMPFFCLSTRDTLEAAPLPNARLR